MNSIVFVRNCLTVTVIKNNVTKLIDRTQKYTTIIDSNVREYFSNTSSIPQIISAIPIGITEYTVVSITFRSIVSVRTPIITSATPTNSFELNCSPSRRTANKGVIITSRLESCVARDTSSFSIA